MSVYFYNSKTKYVQNDSIFTQILKDSGGDKFRRIEKDFLERFGGEIIGFFAYLPFGALKDFNLRKNANYLIMTADFPLGNNSLEGFKVTEDQYKKASIESYNNFSNDDPSKPDSEKYMFRSKSFFRGISDTYKLPDRLKTLVTNSVQPTGKVTQNIPVAGAPYFEKQVALQCGQHAINHILQEQKIITTKKNPDVNLKDAKLKDTKLDMADYCGKLDDYEQSFTQVSGDLMCSGNYDNVKIEGLAILLKHFLGYTTHLQAGGDMLDFIKINIQKRQCLGILINIPGHYVAVAKYYEPGKYTYIDSIGPKIISFDTVDTLISGLKLLKLNLHAVVAVNQNAESYASEASKRLEKHLPAAKKYKKISKEYEAFLNSYDSEDIGKVNVILSLFSDAVGIVNLKTGGETDDRHQESFNALNAWNDRVKDKDAVYKQYGIYGREDDVAGFVEVVNDMNEEFYIQDEKQVNPSEVNPILPDYEQEKERLEKEKLEKEKLEKEKLEKEKLEKEKLEKEKLEKERLEKERLKHQQNVVNPLGKLIRPASPKQEQAPKQQPEPIPFKEVKTAISDYMATRGYSINFTFEFLPLLLANSLPDIEDPKDEDKTTNMDPKIVFQLRKTFRDAIVKLISDKNLNGGGSTHKLKIKKRKTHRKKLLRHKSRNTINRLKLVRQ